MLKFRLRESLGGGVRARHAWVPRDRGLTPCPIPAVPLGFHTGLYWPLGVPWLRCPGKIVPKLCFIGPVPGKLLGVSARTRGGAVGVCWSPVCIPPRLRPGWSVQGLCSGQAGLWALSDRERAEEGMRQVREERRRRGSRGSRRGSDAIRRWMLTQKEERRTNVMRRMLERQEGGGRVNRETQTRELFSRVGLGTESRTVASLSVQENGS